MKEAIVSDPTTSRAVNAREQSSKQNDVSPSKTNAGLFFQAKLSAGSPNDPLEREADAIANQVMRMPDDSFIKRKTTEPEPIIPQKFIQKKEDVGGHSISEDLGNKIESFKGQGNKMDPGTKNFMESRFGTNFSDVNIHTSSEAESLSNNLGAHAFTTGNDIFFNRSKYAPEDNTGKRLLAHELTHTIQQKESSNNSEGMIQRDEDPKLEAIKQKAKRNETLTADEIEYVKKRVGSDIVKQILGQGAAQIVINYDSSAAPQDINRRFQGKLQLNLSGVPELAAKSFEGEASTDIDLMATYKTGKATITLSPPTEDNKLAAMIREMFFPNNSVRIFDFKIPKDKFNIINSVSILGAISISIAGKGAKSTGGFISVEHESVPSGVELIVTLMPSFRSTNVEDTKRTYPGNYSLLTPNPRIFGALGYGRSLGENALTLTLGADLPLIYDSSKPFIYGGIGARGTIDTNKLAKVGGTAFLGLNFDPLSLQLGIGLGAALLKEPVQTASGPAQTLFYTEIEGSISYRIVPNLELLLLVTGGGSKDMPPYGTAQLGAAYRF